MLSAQKVYTGSTMQEIAYLLPCDFLWREAYPLLHYTVVGSKKYVMRIFKLRFGCFLNHANLQCQFFKSS